MTAKTADTLSIPPGGVRSTDMSAIFEQSPIRDTFRISFVANRLVLPVYDQILRQLGINRGEYLLVFCLSHFDELTAQDIAQMTARPRNSISRAVHRMIADGYVTRSAHPTDGRQKLLRITAEGRKLHDKILPLFCSREADILSVLDPDERKTLDGLLQKLVGGGA